LIDPQDTDLRIYQAIQTIAGVEDRSIKEVVADIKQIEAMNNVTVLCGAELEVNIKH
jgi:hypothetical protein